MREPRLQLEQVRRQLDVLGQRGLQRLVRGGQGGVDGGRGVRQAVEERGRGEDISEVLFPACTSLATISLPALG